MRPQGIQVDVEVFDACMQEQKAQARAAWKGSGETADSEIWFDLQEAYGATEFLGYDLEEADGKIVALLKDGKQVDSVKAGDDVMLLTNQTSFYAESGGQAGDKGLISCGGSRMEVTDTKKQLGSLHIHIGTVTDGNFSVGDIVHMMIDVERRNALRANHSCTHLLHKVLREVLGDHVTQKGSLVEAGYFRFDFNHPKALTEEEKTKVEDEVNRIIQQQSEISTKLMTPDEAIEAGAIALFGEKYGDEVRVVSMGNEDYSVELCGGTHVQKTSDIEQFKLTSEGSVASGIRRIEGMTGKAAQAFIEQQAEKEQEEEKRRHQAQAEKSQRSSAMADIRKQFQQDIPAESEQVGNVTFLGKTMEGLPGKELRTLADDFKQQVPEGIVTIIAVNDGKASIVVGVSPDLTSRFNAVDLGRAGSEVLGGKGGGGRPDFAQAGGPDASNAEGAVQAIKALLG